MEKKTLADFEQDIPALISGLKEYPELDFFKSLTPGYQREWAKYVYGAKAESTQEKHFQDMRMILKKGFKSKRGYGQRDKSLDKD